MRRRRFRTESAAFVVILPVCSRSVLLFFDLSIFMKYFCAWVRTCVEFLVPTTAAIAL